MSFPRYPEYKDSGVAWLGDVPGHWGVDRLKASIVTSKNGIWGEEPKGDEDDTPCVRVADFDRQKLRVELTEPTIRNVTSREREGRTLNKGDLLLEKSGGGENQPVGCVVLYDDERPAVCSNFVARVQLKPGMVSSYWRYVHAAAYAVRLTTGSINQTSGIQNLDQDRYYNERAAFPPPEEQTAIATFLDHETAKIDALVAEQEKLIALLQEKRQAVISHVVTKGLDPNVPMKDSGVEWLGEVPGHWEIKSISHILEAIGDVDHFMPASVEKGVPYLMTGDLKEFASEVDFDGCKQVSDDDYIGLSKRIKNSRGDVIMARYATIGTSMYVDIDIDFLVSYSCVTLKTDYSKMSGLYLFKYMKSIAFLQGIENKINANTQGNVGIKDLQSTKIAVPPIHEQTAIATFLDRETAKLDTLMTEARTAIALLQERRTALISAAVTGQIDVRGLTDSANAPDLIA